MIDRVTWLPLVLSAEACEALIVEREQEPWSEARIGLPSGEQGAVSSIRQSSVQWLHDEHWLTAVLWSTIQRINSQDFEFLLTGHEQVQLTKYDRWGHYSWHTDLFFPSPGQGALPIQQQTIRKLSLSLLLSAPGTFHGGRFQAADSYGKGVDEVIRGEVWSTQGSALLFPSTLQHCVTPVTAGVRYSAVLWATGPVWR